jgi:transcriptional regulator with XRE-family HTH domain
MRRSSERNYLRAWREFRGLTQAQLAQAAGTTGAVISLLESGERGLTDKWLRILAPRLSTRPGHLLETDPNDLDSDILEIWEEIPEERQSQARSGGGSRPAPYRPDPYADIRKLWDGIPHARKAEALAALRALLPH